MHFFVYLDWFAKSGTQTRRHIQRSVRNIYWVQGDIMGLMTDKGSTQVSTRGMHTSLSVRRATDLGEWKIWIPFSCSFSRVQLPIWITSPEKPKKTGTLHISSDLVQSPEGNLLCFFLIRRHYLVTTLIEVVAKALPHKSKAFWKHKWPFHNSTLSKVTCFLHTAHGFKSSSDFTKMNPHIRI